MKWAVEKKRPQPMGNAALLSELRNIERLFAVNGFGSSDSNTTLKAEYRLDRASAPVFYVPRDGSYSKSNSLFGASVVVQF